MPHWFKGSARVALMLAGAGILSACSGPAAIYDRHASHFDFPKSNVKPVGAVSAEVTSTTLMFPDVGNPDVEQAAVRKALGDKQADLLIDGKYYWTSRFIPFFLPIYITTLQVEGQAATMTLGLGE